jgi:hypothetical protein
MVKGEAMSEWQYTPIENIAFALEQISQTLERMEKLMTPVPEGEITTSEILSADAEEATEEYTLDEEVIEE